MSLRSSEQRRSHPLSFGYYWCTAVLLCIAGIMVSTYLAISHYRVHTDFGYQSFCALSKAVNCDTVSQSPYSVWWGLPLAVWGVAFYGFMVFLFLSSAAPSADRRRVWTIIFTAAFLCSLASVGFAGISAFFVGSWCILCIATYGINFFLAFLSWVTRKRLQLEPFVTAFVKDLCFLWMNTRWGSSVVGLLGIGLLLTALWLPPYWDIQPPEPSADIKTGITEEGLPWIGAENPVLEIVEFTDYQCFQCRKMHYHLLQLLVRHPGKLRVVQRYFPMDHEFNPIVREPFHVGSGRMAILSIHAAYKGKFEEMSDWLFSKAGTKPDFISLAEAADATGMDVGELSAALQHTRYRLHLKRDIHDGLRLGIVGTPSYVINGQVYEGNLPSELMQPLLKAAIID